MKPLNKIRRKNRLSDHEKKRRKEETIKRSLYFQWKEFDYPQSPGHNSDSMRFERLDEGCYIAKKINA